MTRAEFIQRAVLARFHKWNGPESGVYYEEFCEEVIGRADVLADKLQAGGEAPWDPPHSLEPPAKAPLDSVRVRELLAAHGFVSHERQK